MLPDTAGPAEGLANKSPPTDVVETLVEDSNDSVLVSGDIAMKSLCFDLLRFHVEGVAEADRWSHQRLINKALRHFINVTNKAESLSLKATRGTPEASSWSAASWQQGWWHADQSSAGWQGSSWRTNATDAASQHWHSGWDTSHEGWQDHKRSCQDHAKMVGRKTKWDAYPKGKCHPFEHECKHILADICFFGICIPLGRYLMDQCGYSLMALPTFLYQNQRVGDRFDNLTDMMESYKRLRADKLQLSPKSPDLQCRQPDGELHFRNWFDWDIVRSFGLQQLDLMMTMTYPWTAHGRAYDQYHNHGDKRRHVTRTNPGRVSEGTFGRNDSTHPWPPKWPLDPYVRDDIVETMRSTYDLMVMTTRRSLEDQMRELQRASQPSS